MQTKTLFKKCIIIVPTSLLLLNLAFAEGDYTNYPSEQTEYSDTTNGANQDASDENYTSYQDAAPSESTESNESNDAPPENDNFYNEDE